MATSTAENHPEKADSMAAAQLLDEMTSADKPSRLNSWLIFMGLLLLLAPLYLVTNTIKGDAANKRAELALLQQTMTGEPEVSEEEEDLNTQLIEMRQKSVMLGSTNLATSSFNWPRISAVLANYDTVQLALTGVSQEGNQLMLAGNATSEMAVMEYTRHLENSGRFDRVSIQSITTATPNTSGNQPSQSVPTPVAATDQRTTQFVVLVVLKAGE